MTSQLEQQDKSLAGQIPDKARHCLMTFCYNNRLSRPQSPFRPLFFFNFGIAVLMFSCNSRIQFSYSLLFNLQILFIAGLALVIGLERTFRFFFQKHKLKGSSCFLGGVLVVLFGWPLIGMIVEIYGFVLLFR